jgi:hypothetical protein
MIRHAAVLGAIRFPSAATRSRNRSWSSEVGQPIAYASSRCPPMTMTAMAMPCATPRLRQPGPAPICAIIHRLAPARTMALAVSGFIAVVPGTRLLRISESTTHPAHTDTPTAISSAPAASAIISDRCASRRSVARVTGR